MNKRVDLYDADELYSFIEGVATEHNMKQTLIALPLMKELHKGQFRSGKDKKPYIVHPMMVAKHACALNLLDDELIAAILLHDVIEDCQVSIEELPVNDNVKEMVMRVSFLKQPRVANEEAKAHYFEKIAEHKKAALLKVLDRCNNVSTMGETFEKKRLCNYIEETEHYIFPLIDMLLRECPEYRDVAFLVQYQIVSMLETIKRFMPDMESIC